MTSMVWKEHREGSEETQAGGWVVFDVTKRIGFIGTFDSSVRTRESSLPSCELRHSPLDSAPRDPQKELTR
jgi:hypothetical protein